MSFPVVTFRDIVVQAANASGLAYDPRTRLRLTNSRRASSPRLRDSSTPPWTGCGEIPTLPSRGSGRRPAEP